MTQYSSFVENVVTNPKYFPFLGFTIIRNILDEKEVQHLRSVSQQVFDKECPDARMLLPSHFINCPDLYNNIFNPRIINSLKIALGDPYVQWGDFQVQRNMFGGWHVDSGSENMAPYLFAKEYRFVKCGLFLQDNSLEHGGGIKIRLFSHYVYKLSPSFIRRPLAWLYCKVMRLFEHTLLINKGDFLFFDSRLLHSSTCPKGSSLTSIGTIDLPLVNSKYVLYWNACNQISMNDFMVHSIRRGVMEEYVPRANEVFMLDYLSRSFPEDFDKIFVEKIKSNNLSFASLNKEESRRIRRLRDEISPEAAFLKEKRA